MSASTLRGLMALALALVMPAAHAHLTQTGFGAFYDGMAHLAVSPMDLLLVLAAGLLAGLAGIPAARFTVLALPAAWLAGGLLAQRWPGLAGGEFIGLVPLVLTAALVALDARLRPAGLRVLVVGAGLIHGAANGAAMTAAGAGALSLVGAATAVVVFVTLLAAESTRAVAGWPRVLVRVMGSWITAAGILMFGWLLHAAR